jgi:hypothetical protein
MASYIQRRKFLATLGGAVAAWPLAARAQQGERMRRIGVLMWGGENDPVWKPRLSAFTRALAELGWTDGRNVRMDVRWGGADINRIRALAQELAGGLLSYGPDQVDIWYRAATYVDRILRGVKPSELPVQLPTKFEMVVNLKAAKALGLEIPPSILARADEVIE